MCSEIINLCINGLMYKKNRKKLMQNSNYFKTMLTSFSEKDKNIINITFSDDINTDLIDKNVIDSLFNFIENNDLNILYAYYTYQLLVFFQYDDDTMNKFKNQVALYQGNIDINMLLSLYYLSKDVDYIDIKSILSECKIDQNYLNLIQIFYELEVNDFLTLYDIWCLDIPVNKSGYLPIDLMKLNIIYQPYDIIFFENQLNQYQEGKPIIVDIKVFENNLKEFAYGLDFDIKNYDIIISGGAVVASLLRKPLGTRYSDIDFWIYGENSRKTFEYLIQHIEEKFSFPILYSFM